jgi:uroporphyrinogen-III synthase
MTLAGKHILNTRPQHQAHELTAALRAVGAQVSELPLIAITPLALSAADQRLLLELDRYDAVFFVSANAARLGLGAVANAWAQWPHHLPAFAVGERTARVLRTAALTVYVPSQADSEGLLTMAELNNVGGKRFLLFRGHGGRELLLDGLRARGASIDVLELYCRDVPELAQAQWQALQPRPDVVVFTSPDALRYWQMIAGSEALQPLWLVVSSRMQAQAEALGARVVCASGADTVSVMTALSAAELA